MDLANVLRYLADVADSEGPLKTDVGRVVFHDFIQALAPDVPRHQEIIAAIQPLAAADLLHKEENLAWQGRLWIVGDLDGHRFKWPIVRRRVSLGGGFSGAFQLSLPQPRSSWELTPGLISQARLDAIGLDDEIWSEYLAAPISPTFSRDRYPRLNQFVSTYLSAANLPPMPIVTDKTPRGDEPQIYGVFGVYLERHPYELSRSGALKLWASADVGSSVLSTMYGDTSNDAGASVEELDEPVQSPLPLNAGQREAIRASRRNRISVVSGPPGTGKSHLVAAAAIDQIAAGNSVLIASQSRHACEVIADLLARYPMVEPLRFGDDASARKIGDKLAAGVPAENESYSVQRLERVCAEYEQEAIEHRERLYRRISQLGAFERALIRRNDVPLWLAQRDLDRIDLYELRDAAKDLDAAGLLGGMKRRAARRRVVQQLGKSAAVHATADEIEDLVEVLEAEQLVTAVAGRELGLDDLWSELERLEERWRRRTGDLLEAKRRSRGRSRSRAALHEFATALRMTPTKRRERLSAIGSRFLDVVPLWVGTLSEIEAVLPVHGALFDLVILDEASQISQIAAAPALARAKRAMIVGDSRQLRHVSFVAADRQEEARRRHGVSEDLGRRLDDRANSIFDAATAVAEVVELDEHFRSLPHLIDFSDRTFYDGRLRLMTQHPATEAHDAIEVITVEGERDGADVVVAEVDEALRQVRALMTRGEASIGVMSPFRAQAEAIEARIVSTMTLAEIAKHQLRVGTVHGFQGTERDHIVISMGVGRDDRRALAFAEDPAVFNVMVTRARSHIVVVTTHDRTSAGSGLLGQYLRHADEPPFPRSATLAASGWTQRVAEDLAAMSRSRVITGYQVAGEQVDVVLGDDDRAIGIETDLHPEGPDRHIERHLSLRRAGWDLVSLYRAPNFGREQEAIAALSSNFAARRNAT